MRAAATALAPISGEIVRARTRVDRQTRGDAFPDKRRIQTTIKDAAITRVRGSRYLFSLLGN
jgi:hypothetical protein